jgi:hypothetical protein
MTKKINPDELAIVVAFDPGGTTGWCALGVDPLVLSGSHNILPLQEEIILKEHGEIDCMGRRGEIPRANHAINMGGENAGVLVMADIVLKRYPYSAIVIEDFIIDFKKIDKTRDALSPVRLTSAFSYAVWAEGPVIGGGLERIFIQDRTNPKTTCTDDRLKNWGLYDRHSGLHARDAMRHAFYFLRQCRGTGLMETERRFFAWPHLFDDPAIPAYLNKRRKAKLGERIPGL